MSYTQRNNINSSSGWNYSGAQMDPNMCDQTSSTFSNSQQRLSATQPSSYQPDSFSQQQGGYNPQSHSSDMQDSQQDDAPQTSDFGSSSNPPYSSSAEYGQSYQQHQQSSFNDDSQPQGYSQQEYDPENKQQWYGYQQPPDHHRRKTSLTEKLKGNIETMSGQIQGDPQKVARGEARLRGYEDPTLH